MKINKVAKYIYSMEDIKDLIKEDLEKQNINTDNVSISEVRSEWGDIEITAEVAYDGE